MTAPRFAGAFFISSSVRPRTIHEDRLCRVVLTQQVEVDGVLIIYNMCGTLMDYSVEYAGDEQQ